MFILEDLVYETTLECLIPPNSEANIIFLIMSSSSDKIMVSVYPNTNSIMEETEKTEPRIDALLKDYSIVQFQAVNMSHY
jgi:hypothetical protein